MFTVTRQQFIDAIEAGIADATCRDGSPIPGRLRRFAAYGERFTHCSFAGCGCPLVQVGVLNAMACRIDDTDGYICGFMGGFDEAIGRVLGDDDNAAAGKIVQVIG